ncbi:MAG: hypothetical protein WB586_09825 [Chthoniobacterales bacterium]
MTSGKSVFREPAFDDWEIVISFVPFASGIGEENQVRPDSALGEADQHGDAIDAGAVGQNERRRREGLESQVELGLFILRPRFEEREKTVLLSRRF